ncbi:MAG: bifunctional DNA-formamidopyrimidine glycosylase/DNA-(apurinic or apyrimidinic site) lyase [Chloroflexi bacterium]|nr:bifunctional DNA-formamidopyrimidine glycosylase/DNA-(apurinic or apyrimidinic site) lyase [Chloroflexota bacterium]
MPELPEVETAVRDLRPHLLGRTITGATVRWKRTVAIPSATAFVKQIRGYKITALTRRGKHLVFHLHSKSKDRKYLLVHLRMTGGFCIDEQRIRRDKHMHVCFQLDNGLELRFRDPRKFGRMWLVDDPDQVVGKLGPEPLDISLREFHRLFETRRGNLKPLLLNQTFIAGIGNIYADESLWYARLHPLRRAESLTQDERARLYRAIRKVLTGAIAVGGTSIDVMYKRVNGMSGRFVESLRVFDQEERPCRRCGTVIEKTVVGQRGTHFCPTCQSVRLLKSIT